MLTDRQIQGVIKAATTETILNDGATGRGAGSLQLRIIPTRKGTAAIWQAAWKKEGKRRKHQLGRYPETPLRDARSKFTDEIQPLIMAGKDPRTAAPVHDRPTVETLFTGYLASMRANDCSSVDEVERVLLRARKNAADGLGRDRLAGNIEAGDVAALLGKAYDRGARVAADRMRAYLHAAFAWGIQSTHDYTNPNRKDWGIKHNPVTDVPRDTNASQPRERALSGEEIGRVWWAVDGDGFALETAAAIRLLIACGQRVRETLRARGADFDLVTKTWTLPRRTTKGGKPHRIPLPPQAVAVVRQLKKIHGDGPLFPGRGKREHMTAHAISRALARWRKATKAAPFQTRDLRRTWKSRAADAGVDRFTRDLIQQHAQNGDTGSRHYDHADYIPQMRAAMAKWGAWLTKATKKKGR